MIFSTMIALIALGLRSEQSVLVDADHTHNWSSFASNEEGDAWIDLNWREGKTLDGKTFPTVLMRFNMIDEADGEVTGDMILAVDCEQKTQGIVKGWGQKLATGEEYQGEVEVVTFDLTEPPFDPEDIAIFKAACGNDWTP